MKDARRGYDGKRRKRRGPKKKKPKKQEPRPRVNKNKLSVKRCLLLAAIALGEEPASALTERR